MKTLIITEKPSVAIQFAKATGERVVKKDGYLEGDKYIYSWNYGHLFESKKPDDYEELKDVGRNQLLIPKRFEYEIRNDKGIKHQFKVLKTLLNDKNIDFVINGGDAGREGELIFRITYNESKSTKPVKRLWLSSMEDSSIRNGLNHLEDSSKYDNLYYSGVARQKADWLVGMNGSRKYYASVGRVQTPTLKMIVDRDNEINNFVSKDFYQVDSFFNEKSDVLSKKKFEDKNECDKASNNTTSLLVKDVVVSEKKEKPYLLFSLTSLQKEANKVYGFTAQKVLDIAQSLYEKKLTTYPRTDSEYLTDDMANTLQDLVKISKSLLGKDFEDNKNINRNLNSKKVSDHYAIVITQTLNKNNYSSLSEDERKIVDLVMNRILVATSKEYIYKESDVSFIGNYDNLEFELKDKEDIDLGFKAYLNESKKSFTTNFEKGKTYNVKSNTKTGKTTPPSRYNEATLLSAMERAGNKETDDEVERKGLGTPATRSNIIENLIKKGFLSRVKKNLVSTEKGNDLIKKVDSRLSSPLLTSEFENQLLKVSKGEMKDDKFLSNIELLLKEVISKEDEKREIKPREDLGTCSKCGKPLYKSKFGGSWCPNCYYENKKGSKDKDNNNLTK